MRANGHIDTAVQSMNLAVTYAEDGAVMTALAYLDQAKTALEKEAERRRALGMITAPVELPKKKRRAQS